MITLIIILFNDQDSYCRTQRRDTMASSSFDEEAQAKEEVTTAGGKLIAY